MMEWKISDQDIELTEKHLLPSGAHFPEDARNVIRCWHSADVEACPGSGKTTVLLAKLKLLADRMPLDRGSGICVLSHTNVAVNEIKRRLSAYTDKLFNYPNYVGTIQSFVDQFLTRPYLRVRIGRNVQAVDDTTFAQHMLSRMIRNTGYEKIYNLVKFNFKLQRKFVEILDYVQALYLRDSSLCVRNRKRILAGAGKDATKQYNKLIEDLLNEEGIMRYRDAYSYAQTAIGDLPEIYITLFSSRFQYVFIDEYQDCDDIQRRAIEAIFNPQRCTVIKIGDPDQAIYNSPETKIYDWIPKEDALPIMTSCRYSQEIANVICKLKKRGSNIITFVGVIGIRPILFVFSRDKINKVIEAFIKALDTYGLHDNNGVYKVIGAVKNENLSGLKIGCYWSEFNGSARKQDEYNYWGLVDDICKNLGSVLPQC